MKYLSSNAISTKGILLLILAISLLSVESKKKYRVVTQLEKTLYNDQVKFEIFNYFSERGLFSSDNTLSPFQLTKDAETVNFTDRIFSKENKIDSSKSTFSLKDDCSANYETDLFTMSYKNIKVKYTNGKDTVDANASFVVELKVSIQKSFSTESETAGEISFTAKYTSLELKSVDSSNESVKAFLNANLASFKAAVSKEYDVIVSNSVTVLNDLNNLSLDLRTTLLTDSKSRTLTTSRVSNPICSTNYIIDKFASLIISGYEPEASTNYEFTDSDDQIFYDISIFDEFLKSKTNNLTFSFLYNKENGIKYNSLGFTIKDLSSIIPSVLSQFRGTQEYVIECGITKAFSKVATKFDFAYEEFIEHYADLKDENFSKFDLTKLHSHHNLRDTFLLNSVSMKCDIKSDTLIVETVNLLLNFDMTKDKVENDLPFSLNTVYLIDYQVDSKVYVNDKALAHFIMSSLKSYFDGNPLTLFILDVKGKEVRFNKEGILLYKPRPKNVQDSNLNIVEEFLKFLN